MFSEYLRAFAVGGAICWIGQVLIDWTALTPAKILVGYVVAGVVLSALGIYGYIADFGLMGAGVPLTGFGHLLASGVKQEVAKSGLIGAVTGPFKAASGGLGAAVVFAYLASLVSKPKSRS